VMDLLATPTTRRMTAKRSITLPLTGVPRAGIPGRAKREAFPARSREEGRAEVEEIGDSRRLLVGRQDYIQHPGADIPGKTPPHQRGSQLPPRGADVFAVP